ncbi:MAG: YjbQ family protein [Candidatus Omnitrophica bacterium]|nr:YjbQ family protein [Candidatus Omnitrophota bacterium]
MKVVSVSTSKRVEFIDITSRIEEIIIKDKINKGLCFIFCPHTTAGLTINENADPSVRKDIIEQLEDMVPSDKSYSHSEGNADSHVKASLMGSSLNVIIEDSSLKLGTWQGIYFCEFDGPRKRQVYVKLVDC